MSLHALMYTNNKRLCRNSLQWRIGRAPVSHLEGPEFYSRMCKEVHAASKAIYHVRVYPIFDLKVDQMKVK